MFFKIIKEKNKEIIFHQAFLIYKKVQKLIKNYIDKILKKVI